MKLLLTQIPSVPRYLLPPKPKYLPQHPTLEHPQAMFLPQCQRASYIHMKGGKIIILYILMFTFFGEETDKHFNISL
jgi:hypothetical protein